MPLLYPWTPTASIYAPLHLPASPCVATRVAQGPGQCALIMLAQCLHILDLSSLWRHKYNRCAVAAMSLR